MPDRNDGSTGEFDPFDLALTIEEEGIEFYDELAGKVGKDPVKREIEYLRDEEKNHYDFFLDLANRGGSKKPDASRREREAYEWVQQDIITPMQEARRTDALSNPSEALKLGALLEEKTIRFYESLVEQTEDPTELEDVSRILEQEKEHMRRLQLLLAF